MGTQHRSRPQVATVATRPHKIRSGFSRYAAALCASVVLLACATPTGGVLSNERAQDTVPRPAKAENCHAQPDLAQAQYIIGYGSLMQDESRKRTSPQAGPAHPVEVLGYRRGWFAKGAPVGVSTTFLPKQRLLVEHQDTRNRSLRKPRRAGMDLCQQTRGYRQAEPQFPDRAIVCGHLCLGLS
jgi:hypothetical protein